MEFNNSKEKEVLVDIESGGTISVEDAKSDVKATPSVGKKRVSELLNKLATGILGVNGSAKGEPCIEMNSISGGSTENSHDTLDLLVDKSMVGSEVTMPLVEKKHQREKRKCGKSKRAPKPPRPPRGPSLDMADMKLVSEITQLAMKKRERIERMKELKRMKAAKSMSSAPSPGSTLAAMVITVFFCLLIIFQGYRSNNASSVSFQGAPQPAVVETDSLLSVPIYHNNLSNDNTAPVIDATKPLNPAPVKNTES